MSAHMSFPFARSTLSILALGIALTATAPGAQTAEQAPRVSVAAAYSKEITEEAEFIGRGEAIDKVDIVARVNGFLQRKMVFNGVSVAQGDPLFHIEPDLYEATLQARQADLDRAQADLELTGIELKRKEELLKRGSVPESERDVARANELVAEAEVKSAEAAIRSAKLDLSYTTITAPFDGRLGRIETSVGDIVGPNSSPLVTLVRESPIYVSFSLSEKQLTDVLEELGNDATNLPEAEVGPDVAVVLPNGSPLEETGKIVFVDNRINPLTGTVTVRARFENERRLIVDGAFLSVRISALQPVTRTLIPLAAIQRDQRGDFVLVVNDKQLVEQRYVQTGEQVETAVIVTEGIQPGESVIVEGLQRVRPGVAVNAVTSGQGGE